jgi:hypothetical protein
MMRCKNEDGTVILGIWVHDENDRQRLFNSLLRLKEIRKNSPDVNSFLERFVGKVKSSPAGSEVIATSTSTPVALEKLTSSGTSFGIADCTSTIATPTTKSSAWQGNKAGSLLAMLKASSNSVAPSSNGNEEEKVINSVSVVTVTEAYHRADSPSPTSITASSEMIAVSSSTSTAKAVALLSALKVKRDNMESPSTTEVSGTINRSTSPSASVSTSSAHTTVNSTSIHGSPVTNYVGAKLLSVLKGASTSNSTIVSSSLPLRENTNTIDDLLTDNEISTKAKSKSIGRSVTESPKSESKTSTFVRSISDSSPQQKVFSANKLFNSPPKDLNMPPLPPPVKSTQSLGTNDSLNVKAFPSTNFTSLILPSPSNVTVFPINTSTNVTGFPLANVSNTRDSSPPSLFRTNSNNLKRMPKLISPSDLEAY